VAAGFVDFAITWRADVFSDAPQSSSAANFGTVGINFLARKAASEEEWATAVAALSCTREPTGGALVTEEQAQGSPARTASVFGAEEAMVNGARTLSF
jgi:hypothetical protein